MIFYEKSVCHLSVFQMETPEVVVNAVSNKNIARPDDAEKDLYGHESLQAVTGNHRDAAKKEDDESVVGGERKTKVQTVVAAPGGKK